MHLTEDQLYKVAKILESGYYGSFFSAIGCALQLADSHNKQALQEAFQGKFRSVYRNAIEAEKLEKLNK